MEKELDPDELMNARYRVENPRRRIWTAEEMKDEWLRMIQRIQMKGPIPIRFDAFVDPEDWSRGAGFRYFILEATWKVPDREDQRRMIDVSSRKFISPEYAYDKTLLELREMFAKEIEYMCWRTYQHEFKENFYLDGKRIFDPHVHKEDHDAPPRFPAG